MIQRSCNSIAKRSIQSRRCIFQQPQQQQQHNHHGSAVSQIIRQSAVSTSSSFPSLLTARVSSTTTNTSTSSRTIRSRLSTAAAITATRNTLKTNNTASEILRRTMPFSQDAIRNALPIIGNGAYMALMSGFLMTDMFQLRLMLVGGYTGLVAFHSLHAKPLQIPLRWSALFVVVNAGAAMLLFMDQWVGALLSEQERMLYEEHFKDGLTPGQFYYLLKMATTKEIADGSTLTKEGRVSPNLYFIEKGQAKVYHHGTFAAYIEEGGFVNDVAFQQQQEQEQESHDSSSSSSSSSDDGDNHNNIDHDGVMSTSDNNNDDNMQHNDGVGAYGTVVTHGDCKVLVWNQTELKQYLEERPDMDRNMKYTLSQHLVKSLLKQREVRRLATVEEQDDLQKTEMTMPTRKEFRRIKTSTWP